MPYTPSNWYWTVAGDAVHVFSSASGTSVDTSDSGYRAWLGNGSQPTRIASFSELYDVLMAQAPAAAALAADTLVNGGHLTPQQALAVWLSAGVVLTSTATPELNGTYPSDVPTQQKLTAIATGIANDKGLPGGGSTVGIVDLTGGVHNFAAADFLNFAAALEAYLYELYSAEVVLLGGGSANWPSRALTIA